MILSIFFIFIVENNIKQGKSVLNRINILKEASISVIVPQFWLNNCILNWGVGFGCESEKLDQGRSYSENNINISHCFFSRSATYSGNGGVVCVSGGSFSMNVDFSMFYNCICSIDGGAIYFSSLVSYLRMICANQCSCGASKSYHFAYLVSSQVNQVEYLSISNCSHTTSGFYSIWIQSGDQRVDNTNSSLNNANQVSGIISYTPSSLISSFCTFSSNKVSFGIIIYFFSDTGIVTMINANIIDNNSPSRGVVHAYGSGSRKMMYCIFHSNQNNLFYVHSGSLEVSHSFIDHSSSFSTLTAVSTANNNSVTYRMTYQLHFFNSLHCYADMPILIKISMNTILRHMRSFSFLYFIVAQLIS